MTYEHLAVGYLWRLSDNHVGWQRSLSNDLGLVYTSTEEINVTTNVRYRQNFGSLPSMKQRNPI